MLLIQSNVCFMVTADLNLHLSHFKDSTATCGYPATILHSAGHYVYKYGYTYILKSIRTGGEMTQTFYAHMNKIKNF
jgi:hypothetical protein